MQKHLHDHHVSCNKYFLDTVSVTFIDKTDPSNPLEREQYWRHILQTNAPCGLNIVFNGSCLIFCIFMELIFNIYTGMNY